MVDPISMIFQPLGFSNGGSINPPIALMVGKESQGYPMGWNHQLGVSKNRGPPKWMVYNGNPD